LGVIGAIDDFFLPGKGQNAHDRTENLFTGDSHVVGDPGKDGRLDIKAVFETLEARYATSVLKCRPFLLPDIDVAGDLLMLRLVDERAHLRLRVERIADADFGRAGGETVDETVVDAVLDEDAGAV